MELKIYQQLLKGLTCYIPNCNFSINAKKSLDCRLQDWQQKRFGYIQVEKLISKKCLKISNNLLQAITLSKPMNNFMCKPSAERESNYGAYMYLNEDKEIDWAKIFK